MYAIKGIKKHNIHIKLNFYKFKLFNELII